MRTAQTGANGQAVAIQGSMIGRADENGPQGSGIGDDVSFTLNCTDRHGVAAPGMQVRRLLPVEAERLMGFPDFWTLIPWRGKPASECPDGPRYKALGNSKVTNVVRWLGVRIERFGG